jgi:hypothetical protein
VSSRNTPFGCGWGVQLKGASVTLDTAGNPEAYPAVMGDPRRVTSRRGAAGTAAAGAAASGLAALLLAVVVLNEGSAPLQLLGARNAAGCSALAEAACSAQGADIASSSSLGAADTPLTFGADGSISADVARKWRKARLRLSVVFLCSVLASL